MKNRLLVAVLVFAAACNRAEQPQAPTAAESERLDEAEALLNEMAKEEGPAANAADPSLNSN